MTTDFRALCAELMEALDEAAPGINQFRDLRDRADAALADEPAVLDGREPASVAGQPSDGEVAELAAWLRERATWCTAEDSAHKKYDRAAELLQRLSPPQPVPVSERLPGPEDCDANGRCWLCYTNVCNVTQWTLVLRSAILDWPISHWLPAHALPLPEVGA